jgi:RHS repeat-associated protein
MSATRYAGRHRLSRSRIAMLTAFALVVGLVPGITYVVASHGTPAFASAATGTGGEFVALQGRILDTRSATQVGPYNTPMPAGTWRSVPVDGQIGIPSSGVSAVAVTLTVVSPSAAGLLHADKDEATPNSTITYMNYAASSTVSNTATLAVGTDGKIQVYSSQSTNLVIDVQGYYTAGDPAAGGYVPVTPTRLVDTRNGTGLPQHTLAGGSTTAIQVTGSAGVPSGASGVMVNITIADNTATSGHLFTPYPADEARPSTSMNFPAGSADATGAQVGLSTTGSPMGAFDFFLSGSGYTVDLIVDVVGYFTASTSTGAFTPATARVYDSRTTGHTTLASGASIAIPVAGVAGIPVAGDGISSVTTNLAVINGGTTTGYLEMWADGTTRPNPGSSLNYLGSTWSSNMVTSSLGSDGKIELYNSGPNAVDYVVDVEGWYSNTGSAVTSGQSQTQQSVTLQAAPTGPGSWVTYQYRVGTTAAFANVPVTNVQDGGGGQPSAWPVQKSSGAFTAYTWNIHDTLTAALGSAPDSLIQVQACYGSSSTDPNPACGMPNDIKFAQSAFGDAFATEKLGPGTLAPLTGDYSIDATDAAAADSISGLSIGRTLSTLAPADAGVAPGSQRTDATSVFGPAWTADLSGPDAGDADLKVTDKASSGYLIFTGTDGGSITYQATTPTSTYPIVFAAIGANADNGVTVTKVSSTSITMSDPDGTVTSWVKSGSLWEATTVDEPGSNTTTTYSYDSSGLVTRILAPVPSGISCTSTPDVTAGCRSLLLNYTPITVSGTVLQRLQNVTVSLPQDGTHTNETAVAAYDYNASAQLIDAYDPRITPNLKTAYTYNTAGRLATVTQPGQAAYTFAYDSSGRLSTISRPDPTGSTQVSTVVYGLPITGSSAPITLDATTTGTWDETSDLPVTGTAVFDPDHQPAGTTVSTVSSSDWPYATLHYLDVNGQEVNTAQYGAGAWQIDTTQYDANGNDYWDLTAGNRAQALTPTSATDPYVAGLSSNVARAAALASTSVYNPLNPSQVTDTYGPTHPITLHSGTTIDGQDHVSTTYDQSAPNSDIDPNTGAAYGLKTTEVSDPYNVATAQDTSYPDAQTTTYGYAAVNSGDTTGWTLYKPTTSTVQMGSSPSSSDLTTTTRYNASGQTIETRLPANLSGGTAQSTLTTYFTATGSGSCVAPQSTGMLCSTSPAAQPATGKPLASTAYTYDQYGDVLTKTETFGSSGTVRTTTSTYDGAARLSTTSVTVTPTAAGGTPVPTVTYGYDTALGLPTMVQTGSGGSAVTLTTGYNNVGETTSYTDATGNVSTMTYDLDGRLTSLNDGQGTTSYTYDGSGTGEHRGLITGEDVGVSGSPSTFGASYDADGNLGVETYPNGLTATRTFDNSGNATQLVYAKSGSTWMTFTAGTGAQGRTVTQTSPQSNQAFSYDQDGRLTTVQDTNASSCSTRVYAFDADSNRTSLKSYPAGTGGACSTTTTPATTATSYDQADRDTNTGYAYDDLGRTTTVPSADAQGIAGYAGLTGNLTVGYDSNDMVASQTQGGTTLSFTLDPLQNRISTSSDGTTTTTNHYTDSGDSPAWSSTSGTAWTRNIGGPDDTLAATADQAGTVTLDLVDLRDDIVATSADSTTATGTSSYSESTEFGAPRSVGSAYGTYGWLGAKQRSSADLSGLILMGVRLYDPATGRFLSPDPIVGGNDNAYVYPLNPIDSSDVNGQCWWGCSAWHWVKHTAKKVWHKSSRIAKKVYQHVDVSTGFCVYLCFGVGFQGGHVYNYFGGGGWGTPGISAGWHSKTYSDGWSYNAGGGGIAGIYGSLGGHGNYEIGACIFCGGGWGGSQHTSRVRWN